jgi:hypothetical protein
MDVQSWLRKQLEEASPDLLRELVREFAEANGSDIHQRKCPRCQEGRPGLNY